MQKITLNSESSDEHSEDSSNDLTVRSKKLQRELKALGVNIDIPVSNRILRSRTRAKNLINMIIDAKNDSDLNETILEAYAGFYMIQKLTYGTGAALRIASQLISGCGDNKIGVPGLTELHGILDTHITYLNRFHSANRMFPATASNLQKVFREEFAGSSQVTSEECDQFISNFTSIPAFDLNGLTTFVGDFVNVEGLNPTQIDTRSRMVIRLMELAITGVASAKKPLDKSIRNHVENYFHGIWARLYGDDSPGILHDIYSRIYHKESG